MGPGDVYLRRILAFVVDSLVIGMISSIIVVPFVLSSIPTPQTNPDPQVVFHDVMRTLTSELILEVLIWAGTIAYFFLCEAYWGGQTLGKKATGVKVVMADGSPLTKSAVFKRSILRIVDEMVCSFLVGLLVSVLDDDRRRVGDRVAGTLVVDAKLTSQPGGFGWPAGQYAPPARQWSYPPPAPPGPWGGVPGGGAAPPGPPSTGGWHLPGESNPWGGGHPGQT